jgi:peptidoglycan LD-endopeptidase LytH
MPASKKPRKFYKFLFVLISIISIGFILPQRFSMPVQGANANSYEQNSFWFYPWGKSVTHKGVDIFAKSGTAIHPSTPGFVIHSGVNRIGGNVVMILGPKWRLHYYAHLKEINTARFSFVSNSDVIGTVGTTGNAKGKAPHLHYTIKTLVPYIWQIDKGPHGLRKMFYLNPVEYLNEICKKNS